MALSYQNYTGDNVTDTFSIPFTYTDTSEISVTVDGVAQTGLTFPSASTVQLTSPPATSTLVQVRRATDLTARSIDYVSGSVLTEEDLDNANIQVFHASQEAVDTAGDAVGLDSDDKMDAQSKVIKNVADPVSAQDAVTKNYLENTWLTLDDKAQLNSLNTTNLDTVANDITNVNTVATNIANVNTVAGNNANVTTVATDIANVNTVAADLNEPVSEIDTVANNITNVNTVGGISTDVTTVAGIASDVTAVAADATDIGTVSTNIANVNTVAGISSDVTTVSGISGNVTSVANDATDIGTVASNIANVNTVAGISANVSTVAGDQVDIGTVASNIASVNTVAANNTNVSTVAGISADVTAVAGISGDIQDVQDKLVQIQAVADDLQEVTSEIETVAASIANVDTVGGAITNVNTVATNVADVNTVAGISSNVNTVAGISANVTTVAGISSDVTAVAADATDIGTVATNLAGTDTIGTVATNIANVNSVGGSISNVNTVASNISSVNDFADKYRIGASDPTTDNDEGDLFYNTTSDTLKVYTGTAWEQGVTAGSGFLPLSGGTMTGTITFDGTQTFDGRDVSADGAKLDGIEAGATADQTAAEIRTLVESATDSNVFTDADHSKLNGIEAGATADQTASEILTLIKTVDGAGSGLDADTLDGVSSASFLRSDAADTKTAGDLSFADNVKVNFGASNDLAIYHSGTNSIIEETSGAGSLIIKGTNISFEDGTGAETYATFIKDGAATIRYDNATKLTTTSGGIDVTGTVTADGLDIQGDGTISGGSRLTISDIADVNNDGIRLDDNTTSRYNNLSQDTSGNFVLQHFTGSAWQNNLTVTTGGTVTATAFSGDGSALTGIQAGAGYFQGENGATGDTTNGLGDIFRVHEDTLNTNVTIASGNNALCAGPLTIATGVTLTVNGNLSIV